MTKYPFLSSSSLKKMKLEISLKRQEDWFLIYSILLYEDLDSWEKACALPIYVNCDVTYQFALPIISFSSFSIIKAALENLSSEFI